MSSNRSSRSRSERRKQDILLTYIKYSSTCLELNLPTSLCCDNCEYKHPCNAILIEKNLNPKIDSGKHQIDDDVINFGHLRAVQLLLL